MKHDPTFWILARAAGMTAYVLLTASVLAGLVVKAKPFGRALRATTAVDLHRTIALLALGALAVHGTALVLDSTVEIGLAVQRLNPVARSDDARHGGADPSGRRQSRRQSGARISDVWHAAAAGRRRGTSLRPAPRQHRPAAAQPER